MHPIKICLAVALSVSISTSGVFHPRDAGALIVVGGGGTPPRVVQRAIELAGGSQAIVAVLPHASALEGRGESSVEMFQKAGAGEAILLTDLSSESTDAALARATLVWMPGGSQNRLMEALHAADLQDKLHDMHQSGVAFGGTSAGAAVQSSLMITGKANLEAVVAGGTELSGGLGFLPDVIVDQHAVRRKRFNRLLSAVLDHPEKVGVAVDERTALIVKGAQFEVLGESSVLVIDAREAKVSPSKPGQPLAARGVSLDVLRDGMQFELK